MTLFLDSFHDAPLKDWERTPAYIDAIASAQDAVRLYISECKQTGGAPLTWNLAEIAVGAAVRSLSSADVLPQLAMKP